MARKIVGIKVGTIVAGVPTCTTNPSCAGTVCCESIAGWAGPGWYCVRDAGTEDACAAVELLEADRCDDTIEICAGPFASEADACCGEPIAGWDGEGWYCVRAAGSDVDPEARLLTGADGCDAEIEIVSGPHADEATALATCPPPDPPESPGATCTGAATFAAGATGTYGAPGVGGDFFRVPCTLGSSYRVQVAATGGTVFVLAREGDENVGANCGCTNPLASDTSAAVDFTVTSGAAGFSSFACAGGAFNGDFRIQVIQGSGATAYTLTVTPV